MPRIIPETSSKGFSTGLKDDPNEINRLFRNIYKVLMSRGMKGCYVYSTDKKLQMLLGAVSGIEE